MRAETPGRGRGDCRNRGNISGQVGDDPELDASGPELFASIGILPSSDISRPSSRITKTEFPT